MLKKLLVVFVFLFLPTQVSAAESAIFKSDISIKSDASILIRETIKYRTTTPHHGIYRYVPTNDQYQIKLISITDDQNRQYKFSRFRQDGNIVFKIGDPDITFTGQKIYIITYQVKYPIKQVKDHLELYWDLTGEGWKFPLTNVTTTITSPAPITKFTCYSGKTGSNDKLCQITKLNDTTVKIDYPSPITWNKNLTVALAFPQNAGLEPPPHWLILLFKFWPLPFIFLPTLLLFAYWYRNGRDYLPDKSGRKKGIFQKLTIPITAYEPPVDLTPGQLGLLLDEKVDPQDVVAEIIELARKKYLKIAPAKTKLGFISKTDYIFTKLKEADNNLPPYQKILFEGIFKHKNTISLNSLRSKFYTTFNQAITLIYKQTTNKYFSHNPQNIKIIGLVLAISITIIQIYLTSVLLSSFSSPVIASVVTLCFIGFTLATTSKEKRVWVRWIRVTVVFTILSAWGIYWVLSYQSPVTNRSVAFIDFLVSIITISTIIANFVIGLNLSQKTPLGSQAYLYARGLRRNLELGAWRDKIKEKHLFIERIIPYAIALGIIKQLAKIMKDLNLEPPDYADSIAGGRSMTNFSSSLTRFSSSAGSSLSFNPDSSSSGSSGFSGGSSGGGGGGGGGGSW